MKIILAIVMSADGYVTDADGRPPSEWASAEDQKYFRSLIKKSDAVIIGRNTYEAQREDFQTAKGSPRIVMTKESARYKKDARPGLEFASLSPRTVVEKLRNRRFKKILLAGGPRLIDAFLKAKLIDELHLTIEPALFGGGTPMINVAKRAQLHLFGQKKLNKTGTVMLRYRILYARVRSGN